MANDRFPGLGEDLVVVLREPQALGFEFCCVFDDTGVCTPSAFQTQNSSTHGPAP